MKTTSETVVVCQRNVLQCDGFYLKKGDIASVPTSTAEVWISKGWVKISDPKPVKK